MYHETYAPLKDTHIHPLKCTFTNTLFLMTSKLLTIPIPQCAKNVISETHFFGYSLVIICIQVCNFGISWTKPYTLEFNHLKYVSPRNFSSIKRLDKNEKIKRTLSSIHLLVIQKQGRNEKC